MSNPIRKSYSTTGAKDWIPLDYRAEVFNVSCFTEGGTTGAIEYTVDDLQDDSITPIVAGTVSGNNLLIAATGVRVNVTAAPLIFKVLQAGKK